MLARWIGTGIIAALLVPATIAFAQTNAPDLKGGWSGTAEIVHRSEAAEHVDPTAEPSFRTLPFTITIEQQEGRRFAGSLASARASDPLIGMIRSDGRRLHMVDNDGTLTGELLGPDEMEVCRTEVTPHSMNVYCAMLTRRR
jgi:hypothetical protein